MNFIAIAFIVSEVTCSCMGITTTFLNTRPIISKALMDNIAFINPISTENKIRLNNKLTRKYVKTTNSHESAITIIHHNYPMPQVIYF